MKEEERDPRFALPKPANTRELKVKTQPAPRKDEVVDRDVTRLADKVNANA